MIALTSPYDELGTEPMVALALGADCVAVGKLQGWGLAAGGADGIVRALEIMEDEMLSAMALIGVSTVDQLDGSYVTEGYTVTPPHEMSAWVNMPDSRMM